MEAGEEAPQGETFVEHLMKHKAATSTWSRHRQVLGYFSSIFAIFLLSNGNI